jgi:signal transduction histidine kinase
VSRARGDVRDPDRVAVALVVVAVALLVLDLWVVLTVDYRARTASVVREFVFASSWLVVGCVALRVGRPALARLILVLAIVLTGNFAGSFGLYSDDVVPRALVTLTAFLVPLQAPVGGHLLLAYPTGTLPGRAERRLVVAGYALGVAESLWWGLSHATLMDCAGCARSYGALQVPREVSAATGSVASVLWAGMGVLLLVLLVRRYVRAGRRQRRLLLLPYASITVFVSIYVLLSIVGAREGTSAWGLSVQTVILFQVVGLLGVPLCFLIGLLHERLSYRRIGELVVSLAGDDDADLQRALAVALGDRDLRLVFPVGDGFVDGTGHAAPALEPDDRAAVTAVGEPGAPLALIRHDRSLSEEPALLTAAGSATRLILENARLQAEVRAQLIEVRASRARIVTATDQARMRLERDLHDGAQQRLLAIGIALQLLREQPGDPGLLDAAEEELTSALAEMRDLASGIHPAVLTDLGLGPALDALTRRLGRNVVLKMPEGDVRRLSSPVEAAAYFATTEAVTNALKHASPSRVTVTVEDRGDVLCVAVEDDGDGGADPNGSGLTGVRDRLASVDGSLRLTTAPGAGTRLTMEIPCA